MMHRAWSSIVEVPYFLARSYVQFQGHTALKIVEFDPNWAFPDSNASLNSPMAMKCCTKLETAKERCPIVFQGHPSNFKVTRDKTSPILTQIGRFRTIGRSQLSNPSDLPCYIWHTWSLSLEGVSCVTLFQNLEIWIVGKFFKYFGLDPEKKSTLFDGFFPYLAQMITSMRGCIAYNDLWPWPISSRSFDLDFENRVRSVTFSVLDRLFPYLPQINTTIRGCVTC